MEKPFRNFPDFFKNRNLNLLQGWSLLKSTFFTGKIIPESTRYVPNKLKIQNSIRVCVHLTRCNVCLRIHNDKQIAHTVTLRMSSKRQDKLSQCCTSPETEKNKGRVYSWLALKPVFPTVFSLEKNSIWNVKGSANLIENVVFIKSNKFTRPIQLFRETIEKSLS